MKEKPPRRDRGAVRERGLIYLTFHSLLGMRKDWGVQRTGRRDITEREGKGVALIIEREGGIRVLQERWSQ